MQPNQTTPEDLPLEVSCQSVHRLLSDSDDLLLIDCREPSEHALVALQPAELLPMSQWPQWSSQVDAWKDRHVVVFCHHGLRSAQVATWLRQMGLHRVQSMAGGIDQWAEQLDPSMPRY